MALRRRPLDQDGSGDFGFSRMGPERPEGPPLVRVTDNFGPQPEPGDGGGEAGIEPPGPRVPSRGAETPRDRASSAGNAATPVRPRTPTPMAGSTMSPGVGGSSAGPIPFQPMTGPSPTSLTSSRRGSMYGSLGGLQGGGFGVPLDPTSNQASDPISTLIAQLLKQRG